MRWTPSGRSSDIEDRRGMRSVGMPLGIGGTVIVLVLSLIFGRNLFTDLGTAEPGGCTATSNGALTPEDSAREEPEVQFVSFVLDDAQRTWARILQSAGVQYHDAKLVLFRDGTQSGCGPAESAMGPFYCPLDEKVYIDLGFYDELRSRFGAPGDFAQAYVIAHEIGHHVQNILGISDKVHQAMEDDRQHAGIQCPRGRGGSASPAPMSAAHPGTAPRQAGRRPLPPPDRRQPLRDL